MARELCPTPAKVAHGSKHSAKAHARSATEAWNRFHRVYRCRCGCWHVTTWTVEEWERKRAAWQATWDQEAAAAACGDAATTTTL